MERLEQPRPRLIQADPHLEPTHHPASQQRLQLREIAGVEI